MKNLRFLFSLSLFIPLSFLNAQNDPLIVFEKDNTYGFLNLKGDAVIPFLYNEEGLARVRKGAYYGCIDRKNNFVFPPFTTIRKHYPTYLPHHFLHFVLGQKMKITKK